MRNFEVKRLEIFERIARRSLDRIDPDTGLIPAEKRYLFGPHSRPLGADLRETSYGATSLAMTGSFDLAWKGISSVLDYQDMDPQSLTYGNFLWYTGWESCLDPNIVSFIAPHLCYLIRHCGRRMPENLRERLRRALPLSLTALDAHRATWGYTNIALLNMASKLMIGDVLADPRATKLAYWDWEEWRNRTAELGAIPEFNSPPYTGVQIDALAMMLTCQAEPVFLDQVRSTMQHLIAATVLDFHPVSGRISGPSSRSYPGNRRLRGYASEIETVLHFVLDTPEAEENFHPWIGVPIGFEDIPASAQNPPLPRTTRAATHGCLRENYLCPDYALGHVSGRGRWTSPEVPFMLVYPAKSRRCTLPVLPIPQEVEGHFAVQREGRMLAGTLWLTQRDGASEENPGMAGALSGLRTGRCGNLLRDPSIRPGFDLELGLSSEIRILDAAGREIPAEAGPLAHLALVLETESLRVGLRFAGSGDSEPELSFRVEPDGETILQVRSARHGWILNGLEEECLCAFLLDVRAHGTREDLVRTISRSTIHLSKGTRNWRLEAKDGESAALSLSIPVEPAWMYSIDNRAVTPNQWVQSKPLSDQRSQ